MSPVAPLHSPVFVYGTLMPGESRWPALRPQAFGWEEGLAQGTLWDTGAGYPAAVFSSDGEDIPGVLVMVEPGRFQEVVARLDVIEGQGVLFRRVEVATSGGPATSYEWMGTTSGFERLPDGWRRRLRRG